MHRFRRVLPTVVSSYFMWAGVFFVMLALAPQGLGQTTSTTFPEAHQELLSGASQDWLFGTDLGAMSTSSGPAVQTLRQPSSYRGGGVQIVVGPNVRVNEAQVGPPSGRFGRSETTIASDEEGENLVAGWNDAQGFCGPPFGGACTPQVPNGLSGYGFSTNGGATWTDGGAPDPALGLAAVGRRVFTRGDPWLAADEDGETFFYANLSVDEITGEDLGISVHRGRFRGSAFAWNDVRVLAPPRGSVRDFYDKEAIAADPQDDDNAVVSVTNFQELCGIRQNGFGQIEVWRTRNGGNTWLGPAIAGPEAPDSVAACGNAGTLQQSSVPAFGEDGEVFVTWQFGPTFTAAGVPSTDADIVVARSDDGGRTFGPVIKVADINSMRQAPPVGYNRSRINDHPRIAVIQEGEKEGRVLVVFPSAVTPTSAPGTAQNLTSTNVFLKYSDDGGHTWSAPVMIAGAVPATGVKRFWPVVTVGHNGTVDVVYQESLEQVVAGPPCNVAIGGGLRRIGPAHSLVNTKLVHSTNGGRTFGPAITVSTATSDWCTGQANIRPNFGDYIGSAAARKDGDDLVLPVWHDSRNGPVDTFFAPVTIKDSGSSFRPSAPVVARVSPAPATSGVLTWIRTQISAVLARRN